MAWADPSVAQAGICLETGAAVTGFHRNQAEGPIKTPLSAVTEAAGKRCQNQVPVGSEP